ncbi:Aminodeoxychorismate lyase [Cytospora mali]|uniref:Aminodeoxychorismate lyase n=1 Tax=Cytospora mali TaxID=578113 RepID=A0A194V3M0_CYTMA|nr:Aminodeoxychorismate lyase [Valsa mali var. pyri (nom. inval.)]
MADHFQLFTSLRYDPALLLDSKQPSSFYMLGFHRDRMLRAATHWGWEKAIAAIEGPEGLARLETFLTQKLNPESNDKPMRLKVLLSQEGELGLESSHVPATTLANLFPHTLPPAPGRNGYAPADSETPPTDQPRSSPPYDIYIDDQLTQRSGYTHYKTTKREMYDQARQRAGLKPTDATKEVLIVNEASGTIMEGSLTTPYFWRGGRWVTPPVAEKFSTEVGSGGQDGTTRRWALERGLAVEEEVKARDVADGEAVWLSNGVRGFVFGWIRR